jgi:hypothetical protein
MMQPFGQIPAFEEGDLKLFGKIDRHESYLCSKDTVTTHVIFIFSNQCQHVSVSCLFRTCVNVHRI